MQVIRVPEFFIAANCLAFPNHRTRPVLKTGQGLNVKVFGMVKVETGIVKKILLRLFRGEGFPRGVIPDLRARMTMWRRQVMTRVCETASRFAISRALRPSARP